MIKFEVLGQCFGKGRPRFKKVGNFVQTYSDAKTTNYENLVKLSYINSGCEPYLNGEALICEMIVYYPIPKSNENSYDYFMKDVLFNHININMENVNIPNGEAADADKECKEYEEKLISIAEKINSS